MGKNRYRKAYLSDLDKEIRHEHGEQFLEDFKKTYYYDKLRTVFFESRNVYIRDWNKPKKGTPLVRLTFPIFLLSILIIQYIFGSLRWIFTGDFYIFDRKAKLRKFFERWNDKGGFDVI